MTVKSRIFVHTLFFFLLLQISMFAQEPYYKQFSISNDVTFAEPREEDAKEDLVFLLNRKVRELVIEGDKPMEYFLMHQVTRLQTDAGIESMNEIYISLDEGAELLTAKARVILPSGKVIELKEGDIREEEDYDGRGRRVFFALEGIEKNSVVEFFYVEKEPINSIEYGRMMFQRNIPQYDVSFAIVIPDFLEYDIKSYNGLPDAQLDDTTYDGLNVYHLHVDHIPAIQNETFAYPTANLQRLEFKLSKNTSNNTKNFINYSVASKNVFNNLFVGHSKKGLKKVKKEVKSLKLDKLNTIEEKIIVIERHIKTNFNIQEAGGGRYRSLEDIIKARISNESGITRLMLAMFEEAGISSELVLTSDRSKVAFDPDFETHTYLQSFLMYFPQTKKYLYPGEIDYRYGYFPGKYANNHGLFIKKIEVAGLETGAGKVRWIEALSHLDNNDIHKINIEIEDDFEHTIINLDRAQSGLNTINIQTMMSFLNEEAIEQIVNIFVKYMGEDTEIIEHEFLNIEQEDIPEKPFRVVAKLRMPNLIDRAGNKYLFKIGETIGRQSELYQEEERTLPIEQSFNRNYDRRIEMVIPEGYKIANLDDLKFDVKFEHNGAVAGEFKSEYTLEGNVLKVNVIEYYTEVSLPVEIYPAFQEVINAAADFNKVVLVLEEA